MKISFSDIAVPTLPLDGIFTVGLTASRWFPDARAKGINREHGALRSRNNAVAAPATVSGQPFILGHLKGAVPLCRSHGKADEGLLSVSQETCHPPRSNQPGGDAWKGTEMTDLYLSLTALHRLDWAFRH
jgi:hypothetical protein